MSVFAFPVCWLLQFPTWDMGSKSKPQGNYHHVIPHGPKSLAGQPFSSLSFSLLVFIWYMLSKVFVVLRRKKREKYVYSIFLEAEAPTPLHDF